MWQTTRGRRPIGDVGISLLHAFGRDGQRTVTAQHLDAAVERAKRRENTRVLEVAMERREVPPTARST